MFHVEHILSPVGILLRATLPSRPLGVGTFGRTSPRRFFWFFRMLTVTAIPGPQCKIYTVGRLGMAPPDPYFLGQIYITKKTPYCQVKIKFFFA